MKRPPDTKRTTQNHHITPRPSRAKEARTGRGAHTFLHHIRALSKPGTGSGFSRVSFARGSVRPLSGRNAQRVIVKARVVRINAAIGTKAVSAHINYLVRDGVGMDGEDPTLFTHSGGLEAREVRAWINEGAEDRHQFRFIVSPENADQLDVAQYTKDLLQQMTRDLKTNLNWIAVTHHDTDNPHVHIVLRGVDENGGDLVISRDYLSRGLRAMAQDLATRELGLRTEFELHQQQTKQLTQDRLTPLDQQLEKAADPRQRIDVRKPAPRGFDLAQQHRQRKLIRLRHLAALGLAEEVSPALWQVEANLPQKLRALGNRNVSPY